MSVQFPKCLQCHSDLSQLCITFGSRQWSIPYLSTSVYDMRFSIRSVHAELRGESRNHGVDLLSFSLSAVSMIVSSPLRLLFLVLWPETWPSNNSTLLCASLDFICLGQVARGHREKKISGGFHTLLVAENKIYSIIWDGPNVCRWIHKITQSFRQP